MIFFTDIQTEISSYCLLHIGKYDSVLKKDKKIIFVDPGVHSLLKYPEYPQIERLHYLADGHLQSNEYISIDYPGDMFPERMEEFIERTYNNNKKYADNLQYINTIQFHLSNVQGLSHSIIGLTSALGHISDFQSFKKEFERNSEFFINKRKILGIGNLCRIFTPNSLTDRIFHYIIQQHKGNSLFKNERRIYWVHIYGMAKSLIKKYVPLMEYAGMKVSVDSTKWTQPDEFLKRKYYTFENQKLLSKTNRVHHGYGCSKDTRNEYFLNYINNIKKKIINVKF
ncbi:MAG: hypothetical protein ACTSVK_18000 [Promethearchaeota archaeon]